MAGSVRFDWTNVRFNINSPLARLPESFKAVGRVSDLRAVELEAADACVAR